MPAPRYMRCHQNVSAASWSTVLGANCNARRCLLHHCPERWPLELFWDAAAGDTDIGRAQGCTAAFNGVVRQLKISDRFGNGGEKWRRGRVPPCCDFDAFNPYTGISAADAARLG